MTRVPALQHAHDVLVEGAFVVEEQDIDSLGTVLIAETLYALVLVTDASSDMLVGRAEDAQSTLTHLAARHPSPRSWDLYVVLVVTDPGDPDFEMIREELEADTRYARKLVVAGGQEDAELRLRPLLPLHPIPHIELADPLGAVRGFLLDAEIDPEIVDAATTSFMRNGEVMIP